MISLLYCLYADKTNYILLCVVTVKLIKKTNEKKHWKLQNITVLQIAEKTKNCIQNAKFYF